MYLYLKYSTHFMSNTISHDNKTVSLIDLCELNPELANDMILKVHKYPSLYNKQLENIPYVIFKNSGLRSSNLNKIIGIKGTIIKTGPVLLRNTKIEYTCLKCNFESSCDDVNEKMNMSILCDSCGSNLLNKRECLREATKVQNIRVQNIGDVSSITDLYEICLEGENAGRFCAGNEVVVAGVTKMKWKLLKNNEKINASMYLHALYITRTECDECKEEADFDNMADFRLLSLFEKRKLLIDILASDIHGHSNVKLGLLLVLANMHKEENRTNNYTRQISHLLLIGDPGMAKSYFLNIAAKIVSPSVVTNGVCTSNAGLTSCAVKQGKDWSLEAGAILLADMGICCIDEFNRLRVNEKGGLLEAMEQQTLSVAKAGILSTLHARCSIIAACSIRNTYDKKKTVSENTMISTPLVSRFDLIFGMFDIRNETKDNSIADTVFSRVLSDDSKDMYGWNFAKLKKYLKIVRKTDIKIEEEQSNVLLKYYLQKKKNDGTNEFNTVRMLESLVRLAEAHAKLLDKPRVETEDVYTAILLYETSIGAQSTLSLKYDNLFVVKKEYDEAIGYIQTTYDI